MSENKIEPSNQKAVQSMSVKKRNRRIKTQSVDGESLVDYLMRYASEHRNGNFAPTA